MKREDVERILRHAEVSESRGYLLAQSAPHHLAALCRAWLALDGAVEARIDIGRNDIDDSDMVEIVTDPDTVSHLLYQRVRIVTTPNTTGGGDG